MVGGVASTILEHCSFNMGGKKGLNGIFGMQLVSASKNALQQAGPMLPNCPVNMDWEICAMHPGIFITDDQHFIMSGNPGIPRIGWNGNGKGSGAGNCGSWAFTDTTTHMTTIRENTFLVDMMRYYCRRKKDPLKYVCWSLFLIWVMNNSSIAVYLYGKKWSYHINYL